MRGGQRKPEQAYVRLMRSPEWREMTNEERIEAFRVLGIVRTHPDGMTAKIEADRG
jgi:hypothetical protein